MSNMDRFCILARERAWMNPNRHGSRRDGTGKSEFVPVNGHR